jgi:hypothetical protein
MNFLDLNNYQQFKAKIGMNGKDAIAILIDEIEKKENRIKQLDQVEQYNKKSQK